MYPQSALTGLRHHKARVRLQISLRRTACAEACASIARPLVWMDKILGLWRRVPPFVAWAAILPLGVVAYRTLAPRMNIFRTLLSWAPTLIDTLRKLRPKTKAPPATASG